MSFKAEIATIFLVQQASILPANLLTLRKGENYVWIGRGYK